jgi:hypothetical protein
MRHRRFTNAAIAAVLLSVPSLANKVVSSPNMTINLPNTDTNLKVYGSVRIDVTHNFNGDHYFKDPLLHSRLHEQNLYKFDGPTQTNKINIEKSRFGFSTITPNTSLGTITTKLELEADGNYEETKIGLKLRQATIGFGSWLIGRAESTFIDASASPEILSPSAPIGQPNFSVSNFNLIRYAAPINERFAFAVSLEDGVSKPSTTNNPSQEKVKGNYTHNSRCPTMVGALTYKYSWGDIGARILEQNWSMFHKDCDKPNHTRWSCATQLSGSVNVGKDKIVGTLYAGKGLGAYGADTTSESQMMIGDKSNSNYSDSQVGLNNQTGWQLGYTHNWNDKVRSNITSSRINTIKRDFEPYLKNAQDHTINTIINITKGFEFGVEYLLQKTKLNNDNTQIGSKAVSRRSESNRISAILTAKF